MIDIESIKKEYNMLLEQLTDPELISNWGKFEELSRKKKELERIIEKKNEIEAIEKQIEENKQLLASGEDSELRSLAEKELTSLWERKKNLEKESETSSLFPGKKPEISSIIVEIRAGTGGEEAAIFVADLFKMYSKYGELQGWKQKTLNSSQSELAGFKEIILELKGKNVFPKMKREGGVHRVQRIPITEKSGRLHTSTASVAILPKPEKTNINIRPSDLKIDVYKSSGPGGQYVNKRETAIRITHLPTGIVVSSQTERNLQQNRENAFSVLGAKILEMKEKKEMEKLGKERGKQIGTAKRAEKIRTYNFPQDRVTDHRLKKSFHQLEKILNGELEPIIEALQSGL